jgi:hypothetical protein
MQLKAFSPNPQAPQYFTDRMYVHGIKLPDNGTCFRTITSFALLSSTGSVEFPLVAISPARMP